MQKIIVKGKTYEHRDELKQDGANWDRENKVWYFLAMNEQAERSILRKWNDKERRTWAYVDKVAERAQTKRERVVVYFECDDIADAELRFTMTEQEREIALVSIEESGLVYVDLTGRVRDSEGLTLRDVDELRPIDWAKDFLC